MIPVLSLSPKAVTSQITALQGDVTRCVEVVNHAKALHVHFKGKQSQQAVLQLQTVTALFTDLIQSCKWVEPPQRLARSLPKLVQIYSDLHMATCITTLLNAVESDSSDEFYTVLDEAVKSVIQMADPAKKFEEKIEILEKLCDHSSLTLADSSPRRMGVLLLELMRFALVTLKDNHPTVTKLREQLDRRIDDRRNLFANSTPRYESSLNLQLASAVHNDEKNELLRKAAGCKKPITFWGQFSLSTRFLRYFRPWSGCEQYGNTMQHNLGSSIGGLIVKLNRQFQKVIQGRVTPGQDKEFSHKMDIYIAAYKLLKEELKGMRKELNTRVPDDALLPLLRYTSELRFALSEIALRIATIKRHSTTAALQLFQAVKLVSKQRLQAKAKELTAAALQDKSLPVGLRSIAEVSLFK